MEHKLGFSKVAGHILKDTERNGEMSVVSDLVAPRIIRELTSAEIGGVPCGHGEIVENNETQSSYNLGCPGDVEEFVLCRRGGCPDEFSSRNKALKEMPEN